MQRQLHQTSAANVDFFSRLTNVKFATLAQQLTYQRELLQLKHTIFPRARFTKILQNRHPHPPQLPLYYKPALIFRYGAVTDQN